jgi:hypothetical protein
MGKKIIDKVLDKKTELIADKKEGGPKCGQNALMGIAAINGGIKSAALKAYMMQFVEQNPPGTPVDPAQLARLLATDGTLGDPELDMHRAYMVANAVCNGFTPNNFDFGVETIDHTI